MNYNIYTNGAYQVFSPRKKFDWSFNWRRVDDFVAPFLVIGLLIFAFIKVYTQ